MGNPKDLRGNASKFQRILQNPIGRRMVAAGVAGVAVGAAAPIFGEYARRAVLHSSVDPKSKDLGIGIERYREKLRKQYDRKYKGSKDFVNEYETKKELGIDSID
jgi:hypothetical protein